MLSVFSISQSFFYVFLYSFKYMKLRPSFLFQRSYRWNGKTQIPDNHGGRNIKLYLDNVFNLFQNFRMNYLQYKNTNIYLKYANHTV